MTDHRIVLGDCLDPVTGLASLADKGVDAVISDPPYSEWVHAQSRSCGPRRDGSARYKDLGFSHLTGDVRDAVSREFARVCRRWALVFCDVEGAAGWRGSVESAGLEYVRTGVWVKPGAAPQFSGDRPAVGWEAIVIAHPPGKKRWNGGGSAAVWTHPIVTGDRQHTTQKPLALMEALVRDFTDPGDLVLDPFAGSGTTGVACRRLGRRFIGFERDAKYHAIAEKRIAGAREQLRMFEGMGA